MIQVSIDDVLGKVSEAWNTAHDDLNMARDVQNTDGYVCGKAFEGLGIAGLTFCIVHRLPGIQPVRWGWQNPAGLRRGLPLNQG